MAAAKFARKVRRYSDEFKLKAVALTRLKGVLTEHVAAALLIHPIMLTRWKRDLKEGRIVRKPGMQLDIDSNVVAELRELREVRRKYKILQEEHELLKKAIRFTSERRRRSSPLSGRTKSGTGSR